MPARQRWTDVRIVTPERIAEMDLLTEGDRIAALIPRDAPTGEDVRRHDGGGAWLYPGIIDLLQHGMDLHLYSEVEPGAVDAASRVLLRYGTTAFLPSIGCMPPASFDRTLAGLADECRKATGARVPGLHSEGPCFALTGAHNPANLDRPDAALAGRMLAAADGMLAAVTVAPELPGAGPFIRALRAAGVSIHLGHSKAAPEDIPRYLGWGVGAVTHMFDVMPNLPPDGTGVHPFSLPDALLAERGLPLGVVADGIHCHPKLLALLAQLPRDRVFLETDAMKHAGRPATEFEFYPGYRVTSAPGRAVRDAKGGLCGSSLTPDEAMRNYIRMGGADLVQAGWATGLVPARVLGRAAEMGSIEPGKLADFALLDPGSLTVRATVVGGTELWRA